MLSYFDYYNIPCQYKLNQSELRKLFYSKSKDLHPDQSNQMDAIDQTSVNNEAYRILSDPHLRLKHILEIFNGPMDESKMQLPKAFFMDMMDINEEIEFVSDENRASLHEKIKSLIQSEEDHYNIIIQNFDKQDHSEEVLRKLEEFYFKQKYYYRMLQNMNREEVEM
ncbi:MAG TPA: iron-sulfur cluster co-chaperone HscB C-terminal domain-containing protein [Saprospiraceae bacterium]|nr:iron-sulfur cluster co-chaperone HscB C-terminal domain-containing protein [Saprospiraceae bacterium]